MTPYEYQSAAEMRASYAAIRRRWGLTGNPPPIKTRERGVRLYGAPIGPEYPIQWEVIMRRRAAIMSLDERPVPTLKEIKEVVAATCDLHITSMESVRRGAREVKARQIYYWIARKYTRHSLPEIGRRVGGKDHSTVLHGIRCIDHNRAKFEPELSQAISAMRLA